jgi:hypothetical protein
VRKYTLRVSKERVKAGLENAKRTKRRGKKLGRPGVGDTIIEEAKLLIGKGKSFRTIGKQLGVSEEVARRGLKG